MLKRFHTPSLQTVLAGAVIFAILLSPIFVQNKAAPFALNTAHAQAAAATPNTAASQAQQNTPTPPACSTFSGGVFSPLCWIQSIVFWVAAALISFSISIMTLVGWLFDFAISQTVLGFNSWVSGDVLTAIGTGWTFFRDLANIVIIGLFVFIAICIILGIKSYGQRSLIARVLIVAVLINFSFLFTRIVINFSNALAIQFAKVQPLGASVTPAGTAPPDIAGKFTQLMGANSFTQTKDTLDKIAKNNNSFWLTLLHAFIVCIMALGIAIVLLYGSFLLIARALIFIFLLVTSSLAFATYLLPSFASSEFGWKAWWTALFKNAMLAPIMMMFLAVTLKIGQGLVAAINPGGNNSGVLGALAAHPDDPKDITALLIYVIILGLLYGAIKISNSFAGAAGQIAWAGASPFANATVAWPSRSLGFLGRNTIGRGADAVSKNLQDRAKAANLRNPGGMGSYALDKLAQAVKPAAKRDFNPGNLTNVKSAQTRIGGHIGAKESAEKEIKDRQKRLTPTKEELKLSADALKKARGEAVVVDGKATNRGAEKDKNDALLKAAKSMEDSAKKTADAAELEKNALQQQIQDKRIELTKAKSPDEQTVIKNEIAQKESDMREKSDTITNSRNQAQEASKQVVALESNGKSLQELLDKRAATYMDKPEMYVKEESHKKYERLLDDNIREDAYKRFSNFLNRAGGQTMQQDSFTQDIVHSAKHDRDHEEKSKPNEKLSKEVKGLTEAIKQMAEQQHEQTMKTNEYLKEMKDNTHNRKP